jgi:hypothetical protein
MQYTVPKTDSLIPEEYSDVFKGFTKNIFEISLPRYFDETNQTVKIENISPQPTKLGIDTEGNIIATFEIDATQESTISIHWICMG